MKKINLKPLLTLATSLTLVTLLLAACSDPTATNIPTTNTAVTTTGVATTVITTNAATSTPTVSIATVTPIPTTTTKPTPATTTIAPQTTTQTITPPVDPLTSADVNRNLFFDDRSNPLQLIRSYYNAINRHEYVRAYSYLNLYGLHSPPLAAQPY